MRPADGRQRLLSSGVPSGPRHGPARGALLLRDRVLRCRKMRGNAARRLALMAALSLPFTTSRAVQAASYPPHLRFQTISTEQVSIHFHQGFEREAREASQMELSRQHSWDNRFKSTLAVWEDLVS